MITYLGVSRPKGDSFTPEDLMSQAASERPRMYAFRGADKDQPAALILSRIPFTFDHWTITDHSNPNLISITLCLRAEGQDEEEPEDETGDPGDYEDP